MKWISVKDSLPSLYDYVLVFEVPNSCPSVISVARYTGKEWEHLYGGIGCYMDIQWEIDSEKITHWMELPWPPVIPEPPDQVGITI